MTMVRYGGAIIEKEGKQGGFVWWRDWCMNHVTQYIYRKREPSEKQKIQRNYFKEIAYWWSNYPWTQQELSLWRDWCYNHPLTNKKGEVYYWHPYIAFEGLNLKRLKDLQPIIFKPPTP